MVYAPWLLLLLLLAPYWLGPIVVWLTQKAGARPVFEPFTPPASLIVVRLPIVRDPARLCRITRAYLDRHYRGVERVPFEHQDEPARFLGEAMARELTEQVEAGRWRRDDRTGVFRPTFPSAWVMTWQALPPFSLLRRRRVRRRATAILEELNMAGPDPRPIAQPRTRVSLRCLVAVAIIVYLLTQFGSRVLRTSWTLPADFVVPAAFPDAVRALERLAGGKATPLVGTDSVGDSLRTEGFAVSVPSARAERLVSAAQPRFLEKGYYLFRSEQHFGIGGHADRVALFPRSDPYEILRLMGTNGWNYDIGPDSIVAWLKVLERDHPFVLTGMGFDWVEGQFRSAIRDANALARRFYAFCPDVVSQGTETVEALAQELVASQRLYCWWD